MFCLVVACIAAVVAPMQRAEGHTPLMRIGATVEERELVSNGHADLHEVEDLLALPPIPIWPEARIGDGSALVAAGGKTVLAAFHPPSCNCGRPYGIAYDLAAVALDGRYTMNEVLLHECVHAWQYWLDPDAWAALTQHPDQPHEVAARKLAREMHDAGVRVWFPALG